MLIELKQNHIDNGKKNSCRECAVALSLREALGIDCKVTGLHVFRATNTWDAVTGDLRIAEVGKKLRFYINDFDTEPSQCEPITMEFVDGVVEIVDEYAPLSIYRTHHMTDATHTQGKCGCILCTFGEDGFTEAQRKMLRPV